MPIEKSAGAVIFIKKGKEPLFLLLHYPATSHRTSKDYWDLPKGHIEKGEKLEDTVKREIREETGLTDIGFINGFKETIKYFFQWGNKNILKFVTFFLVETKTKEVNISGEHAGFEWLPYNEAVTRLTFKNAKQILQKAHNFIPKEGL